MTNPPDIALNKASLGDFYSRYFQYYSTLDSAAKELFIDRAIQFITQKEISGEGGFKPLNSTRAIIAASAVQLTLGLKTWKIDYFDTIIIHQSDFDHVESGLKFKGETNMSGIVKLSWKSFIHGYKVTDDNVNLGLHEFTHALKLNSVAGLDQDYFFENYFPRWLSIARGAFIDLKEGRESIFRKYGGTNIDEFLCVCIEHYFESPLEIKEKYPLLYYSTGILLNQETENGRTSINVRNDLFIKFNALPPGFQNIILKSSWKGAPMVLFSIGLCAIAGSLLAGELNLLLMSVLLLLFLYVRFELRYRKIVLEGKRLIIKKGLVFRRRTVEFTAAHIVSCIRANQNMWRLRYYNTNNEFFYEEDLAIETTLSNKFMEELKQNNLAR
jgi:MtfA peptidase